MKLSSAYKKALFMRFYYFVLFVLFYGINSNCVIVTLDILESNLTPELCLMGDWHVDNEETINKSFAQTL